MISHQSTVSQESKVFYEPKLAITFKLRTAEARQENHIFEFFKRLFSINISKKPTNILKTIVMLILGCVAIGFGVYFNLHPANRTIARVVYDKICQDVPTGAFCELSFEVKEKSQNISVFYRLPNFISNHKEYLVSKSSKQLHGQTIQMADAQRFCYPFITNRDMNKTKSWNGTSLDPNAIASPCGFQAYLYFQDIFEIITQEGRPLPINRTIGKDIFKQQKDSKKTQWIDPTIDEFQIWMTTSVGQLQKIYGQVVGTVNPGNHRLRIKNNSRYPGISKQFVLMEVNTQDGSNRLVGTFLIVLGPLLFCFIAAYLYISLKTKKANKVQQNTIQGDRIQVVTPQPFGYTK